MCYNSAGMKRLALLALVAIVLGSMVSAVLVPVASADPCADLCEDDCCDQSCERCECCAPAPPWTVRTATTGAAALDGPCAEATTLATPLPPPRDILHVPEPSSPR